MRQDKREKRQAEIEDIAYEILETKGFEGLSMAFLAKQASASLETLYRWYGDKNGLFSALVMRNSNDIVAIMDATQASEGPPEEKIKTTSEALLKMLSGEKAIALNRAAVNDETGTLGQLLSASGRSVVGPHLAGLLIGWRDSGAVFLDNPKEATGLFVNLLIGDHQIQRATRVLPPLSQDEIEARVMRAMVMFQRMFAPE